MANLRIKRRTKQIDDNREVLISQGPNGPIWTTVGENKLTGDDKAELSANLAEQRRQGAINEVVQKVRAGAALFFECTVMNAAPRDIVKAYENGEQRFLDWFKESGFTFKQDGLRSIVLRNGKEVGTFTAKIDPRIEQDVVLALRLDQLLARQAQGGSAS